MTQSLRKIPLILNLVCEFKFKMKQITLKQFLKEELTLK